MQQVRLEPGRVYRTEELYRYGQNPTRLAGQLIKAGRLRRLRHGVYYVPTASIFGEVPPAEAECLRSYFRGRPYLRTGPSVWNALGLGSTAVEVVPLVYNTTRTGEVRLGGQRFELRRVKFPRKPGTEFFVVDLLENLDRAGVDLQTVKRTLRSALQEGRFDRDRLLDMAARYGRRCTEDFIRDIVRETL
jgi:hypothetical protein